MRAGLAHRALPRHRHRRLTVRTARDGDRVLVEIGDNGPDIPRGSRRPRPGAVLHHQPVGQDTGLGLDIVAADVVRRHGDLRFTSAPGDTRFQVLLPLNPERVAPGPG